MKRGSGGPQAGLRRHGTDRADAERPYKGAILRHNARLSDLAGKYSPSLETAFRMAEVFNVPIGDVFQYGASRAT